MRHVKSLMRANNGTFLSAAELFKVTHKDKLHPGVCDKCRSYDNRILTGIPVFSMFVCDKCLAQWWNRWGFQRLKRLIHYE